MKKIWITALSKEMKQVQPLIDNLAKYGLQCGGHYWTDDLEKNAWTVAVEKVVEHDVWVIISSDETLAKPSIRYGLSLAALSVLGMRGYGFPMLLVHQGQLPTEADLPTPLRSADIYKDADPVMPAKLVAKAAVPPPRVKMEYELKVHGLPQGTAFEIRPTETTWSGALVGITEDEKSELGAVAPGEAGKMPEKAILEYPMRDIKLALGEQEYIAAAFQNQVDPKTAVFAMIHGEPRAILFGAFNYEDSDSEFYTIQLR